MKKTIKDFDLKNKKVLIRVDFNVPIKEGNIADDNRIKQSIKTIQYAVEKGAKVILLSHLGRIKTEEDKNKNSLKPVSIRLSEYLKKTVLFIPETRGAKLEEAVKQMHSGDVLLIENTRFEDLEEKKESHNDAELGAYWASLGDIFINDAFGTAHRAHASNVGIASNLPSGIGFLVEKEIEMFENTVENPARPFTVILGGAKVSDKIEVIHNLAPKVDFLLIGGGMAYTFLKAENKPIGNSLCDQSHLLFCKEMMQKYGEKIILPVDTVNVENMEEGSPYHTVRIEETKEEETGLDIGPKTRDLFASYVQKSKTIIWNGPMGMFEKKPFDEGTHALAETLVHCNGKTIIGGGDTAAAIIQLGYEKKMDHISTGGGASLCLLEGKGLPGIDAIENR